VHTSCTKLFLRKKKKKKAISKCKLKYDRFNNIKTVLFLDFSFNMLTVMTEILGTVHPPAQAKELTMHQTMDVSRSSGGKGKEKRLI
jgi:hypothetical protein